MHCSKPISDATTPSQPKPTYQSVEHPKAARHDPQNPLLSWQRSAKRGSEEPPALSPHPGKATESTRSTARSFQRMAPRAVFAEFPRKFFLNPKPCLRNGKLNSSEKAGSDGNDGICTDIAWALALGLRLSLQELDRSLKEAPYMKNMSLLRT